VYRLLNYSCCDAKLVQDFKTELDARDPKMIKRECTNEKLARTCNCCGVKQKFYGAYDCPVWKKCDVFVKTSEWKKMIRSGLQNNGQQRTQNEIMPVTYKLHELATRFLDHMEIARCHMNDTYWANRAIKNVKNSTTWARISLHIDYAATMDLTFQSTRRIVTKMHMWPIWL
jgi:hypothetical protein